MDGDNTNTQQSSMKKFAIPGAILVIVVIAAIAFYTTQSQAPEQATSTTTQTAAPTQPVDAGMEQVSAYADGTYEVTGDYVSPGGPRDIGVTIVLVNGVITDATFEARATDATSKRFQDEFGDNFKSEVVGRNIDEVVLVKVSGSSLTPNGFNDAVEKVKLEASQT